MIKIANAPCSWGVIENTAGERKTYLDVLREMSAAGYEGTELGDWGFMPTDPSELITQLEAHNLQLIGSWVTVRLYDADYHKAGIAQAIITAELLANVGNSDCLIIIGDDHSTVPERHDKTGRITPKMGLDQAGWVTYADGASKVARAVKEATGLRSALHPHGATFVETPAEIETFFKRTDPDLLGMVFDTGHFTLGGGDAVAGIHKYADRIWHVHFKDFDQNKVALADKNGWGYQQLIGQGVFPELGQGVVDFTAVSQALKDIKYDGWIVVEQDVLPGMGLPAASARRNRDYLRSIGL